jgi:hypothetical protein
MWTKNVGSAILFVGKSLVNIVYHSKQFISVGNLDPEPDTDPHVFGPPGSGSISQRYGSGSGARSGSFPFLIKVLSGLK